MESICANFETALEISNSWISECETRVLSVEERVQSQTATISEFINSQEQKLDYLERQMNKIEQATTPANQITYLYKTVDDMNTQTKFYGIKSENPIHFLKQCERNMKTVNDNLSEVDKINWVVLHLSLIHI